MKGIFLMIFGQVIGFVSTFFMILVFANEYFLHKGLLFIEPNVPLAGMEFVMVCVGMAIQVSLFAGTIFPNFRSGDSESKEETNSYDTPYQ